MTREEEIEQFIQESFEENKFEDTPDHRLAFMEGLRDAWKEDPDESIEKSFYLITLHMMIFRARLEQMNLL